MTLALLVALVTTAKASDYTSYYKQLPVQVAQVERPVIPANTVDVRDYGGAGDGLTLNSEAFRKAVSALVKLGGGRLNVPAGVWLTGPIQLKDNIELHLEKNAILYFSPDKQLYVDTDGKSKRVDPCIKASKRKNIAITGEGIIDGNGAQWRPVKRDKVSNVEWKRFAEIGGVERQQGKLWYPWDAKAGYANIADTPEKQEAMRQDLIRLTNCENVLIEGVTVQNSPRFHVHPVNCRNVIIDGVTVRCPWNAQNGDAIDISDCHRVLIVNSTVDAGDDGICLKSGDYDEKALVNGCEDILIADNTVFHAHGGFVVGSETVSGMKRVVVRDCRFSGTDTGLRFKSAPGRGGKTEAFYISNIYMADISNEAIIFQTDYVNRHAGREADAASAKLEKVPEFTDIHISNVICRGAGTGIAANGIEGRHCVSGVEISNSTIIYTKVPLRVDTNTSDVKLSNVRLEQEHAAQAAMP